MNTTVPTNTSPATEASAEDRTITYPLRSGGILVDECPTWCVVDHSNDITSGKLAAVDLYHQGKTVELTFKTVDGAVETALAANIRQYPYDPSNDGSELPHVTLVPSDSGMDTGYLSSAQLLAEAERVWQHYIALRRMGEELAAARVHDHDVRGRDWRSITPDDIATMPIHYLMQVFGVTVVEGADEEFRLSHSFLHGKPGAVTIRLFRGLTQILRDQHVRHLLGRLAAKASR